MINYKRKGNLPRTFNHCISPLLKSATHNNITPQINFLKLSPTPPPTHKRTKTNYKPQSNNLYGALSNTNIPASRHYPMFPNPINATLPQTKHSVKIPINSLSTRPNRAPPSRTRTPTPTPQPIRKKRRHTRAHSIPFPLTDQSEQIINLGHNPPIKTLYTTNYPHIPNEPAPLRTRPPQPRRHTPAPIPAIYNTVSINLAPSLRTHKRTKTNYKLQSTGLIRVFIPPLHDIHHSNPEPDFSQKRIAPP